MSKSSRFEEFFRQKPLMRDIALVALLTLGFGLPFKWLFEYSIGEVVMSYGEAVLTGLMFAVLWIAAMEVFARYKDSSIIRSIGEDPLEE